MHFCFLNWFCRCLANSPGSLVWWFQLLPLGGGDSNVTWTPSSPTPLPTTAEHGGTQASTYGLALMHSRTWESGVGVELVQFMCSQSDPLSVIPMRLCGNHVPMEWTQLLFQKSHWPCTSGFCFPKGSWLQLPKADTILLFVAPWGQPLLNLNYFNFSWKQYFCLVPLLRPTPVNHGTCI